MHRDRAIGVALDEIQLAETGLADACCIFQNDGKNRPQVAGRSSDDLKHLRRGGMPLQCLITFAGKPSDFCFLIGSRGLFFCALRRLTASVLRRLAGLLPALERLFIASPVGSGEDIVAGHSTALEAAYFG